jgi:hypothetical protein
MGHSWGGSLMVFTNRYDLGQSATIDLSGAEMSWGNINPFRRDDLKAAMSIQRLPIYFLQPKNARSLAPGKVLFGLAANNGYLAQAAIFPSAPCDADPCEPTDESPEWKQAHDNFVEKRIAVETWGMSVVDFVNRNPRP